METTIIRMSLGGAILISVIVLIRLVGLSKLPKRLFPALWCLALLRLLTPLSVPVPADLPVPALPIPDRQVVEISDASAPADNTGHPGTAAPSGTVHTSLAPARPAEAPSQDAEGERVSFHLVPAVWAAVGLGLGLYFAVSRIRFCRELRTAVPVENEFASRWLAEQRPRRRVRLRELAGLPSPLTYGVLRPVILVPRTFDWSDTDGAGYVLYHEYTHIRRFDSALKLLMDVALCLHWFNPMVWVMYFLFDRDLELACDEAVLRHYGYGRRRDYAETIIGMEEKRALPAPFGSFFSKNTAEERIRAIMKFRKNSVIALSIALVLALAGTVIVFATASGRRDDTQAPPATGDRDGGPGTPSSQTPPATENGGADTPSDGTDSVNDTTGPGDITEPSEPNVSAPWKHGLSYYWGNPARRTVVDATLYTGDGYSVLIPDEGWSLSAATWGDYSANEWVSAIDRDAILRVVNLGDVSWDEAQAIVRQVEEAGPKLIEMKDGSLGGEGWIGESGIEYGIDVGFYGSDSGTFAVFYRYPSGDVAFEQLFTELHVMSYSFSTTDNAMDWMLEHVEELSDRELIDFAARADGAHAEGVGYELARRFAADPLRLLRVLAEEKEINVDGAIYLLAGEWIIAGTQSPLDGVAELELTEAERGILDDITAEYENSLAQYLS